jgi:thiosulfate/3-mercaptopyruvate sulfurtransferase
VSGDVGFAAPPPCLAEVPVRPTSVVAFSIVSLSLAASAAAAQTAANSRDALLVTPEWVAAHIHDPNTVLLHVGDPGMYPPKHIAGARFVDLSDISVSDHSGMQMPPSTTAPPEPIKGPKNGLILEMPTAEQLRSQLSKFGISDNTKIIVYSANEWYSPATRVVFTLDYAGLGKNVVEMDGGLEAWTRQNRPVTDVVPPPPQPGKLSALALRPLVVDASYVNAHATTPGVSIVDARRRRVPLVRRVDDDLRVIRDPEFRQL